MEERLQKQEDASSLALRWAHRTQHAHGRIVHHHGAQFAACLQGISGTIALTSDGIGTKIEVAERLGRYDTLGHDLVAMVADDLAAQGAEPLVMTNVLDVDRLELPMVDALMAGLHAAATLAGIVVSGGEIAELGERVAGWGPRMHCNWSATALGVLRPGWQSVDGRQIGVGDAVIALQSQGFRANGFTAIRQALAVRYGDDWHRQPLGGGTWGEELLAPSTIYSPLVIQLRNSNIPLHGLSHLTGGGLVGKMQRTLRASGLGANLPELWPASAAMREAQELCRYSDLQAYSTWNMGNGFLLVVPPSVVVQALNLATSLGYFARLAGEITSCRTLRVRVAGVAQTLAEW